MFAVPGFTSLTPDLLKQQTDVPSSSRKRKRGKDKAHEDEKVTSKEFEELWKKHVEGPSSKQELPPTTIEKLEKKKPKSNVSAPPPAEEREPVAKKPQEQSESQAEQPNGDIHPSRANLIASKDQPGEPKSKRSNKRRRKARTADAEQQAAETRPSTESPSSTISKPSKPPKSKGPPQQASATMATTPSNLTPLQAKMHAKLLSARFRHLNEQLYTTPSTTSSSLFSSTPSFFSDYHAGFAAQVAQWPENPVSGYIDEIRRRAAVTKGNHHQHKRGNKKAKPASKDNPNLAPLHTNPAAPLPLAHGQKHTTIADLGAGTAPLAHALQPDLHRLNLRILSYDLHAPNALVTQADVARLPLADAAVDVAVFCLALMGTNWLEFVEEAWRVLRWRGELWVAEIKSRFARQGGAKAATSGGKKGASGNAAAAAAAKGKTKTKEQKAAAKEARAQAHNAMLAVEVDGAPAGSPEETTDVGPFVAALRRRGFALDDRGANPEPAVDMGNRMFVKMRFVKVGEPTRGKYVGKTSTGVGEKGKKAKFLDDDAEMSEGEEAGVLKPCVYKLR